MEAGSELRWILLGLGALFLVGLALWELRRPRHASRRRGQPDTVEPAVWQGAPVIAADEGRPVELPELRDVDLRRDPPIVLLDDLDTSADTGLQVAVEVAVDRPSAAHGAPEPDREAIVERDLEPVAATSGELPGVTAAPVAIQWPPERQDRILWLRVVAADGQRFGGRVLRQALNGCGLVHGPQDIFHWADERGRVIASAANLLRPGSFDLQAMDVQDFPGLHVFAVLPGPLPPVQTYDELLSLARDLASRLGGELRDERGNTVDASTVEAQRLSLQDGGAGA